MAESKAPEPVMGKAYSLSPQEVINKVARRSWMDFVLSVLQVGSASTLTSREFSNEVPGRSILSFGPSKPLRHHRIPLMCLDYLDMLFLPLVARSRARVSALRLQSPFPS
jgi:hypothetical protein